MVQTRFGAANAALALASEVSSTKSAILNNQPMQLEGDWVSALVYACADYEDRFVAEALALIRAGADVNTVHPGVRDLDNTTALHAASAAGNETLVRALLSAGASTAVYMDRDAPWPHENIREIITAHHQRQLGQ